MELSDILLILGVILFVVLLVAAWGYVDPLGERREEEKAAKIKREGSQTTGKVTATQTRQVSVMGGGSPPLIADETTLDYEYEANGRRFTGTQVLGGDLAKRTIGSEISVRYLPESPDEHMIEP